MQIESVSIENFRSFRDKQTTGFGAGFNIILGANNSGKTTLLEAIQILNLPDEPHRSIASMPNFGDRAPGFPRLEVTFLVTLEEIKRITDREISIPLAEEGHRDAEDNI